MKNPDEEASRVTTNVLQTWTKQSTKFTKIERRDYCRMIKAESETSIKLTNFKTPHD